MNDHSSHEAGRGKPTNESRASATHGDTVVVLGAQGMLHGSSAQALEGVLRRLPGVHQVEASPVSDSVTVVFDAGTVRQGEIERAINECGYHCRGEVVPAHVCVPAPPEGQSPAAEGHAHAAPAGTTASMAHMAHEMGHGAGMTMDQMVRDMRNRFWVTLVLGALVTLYSPMGSTVFRVTPPAPFGLSSEILMFVLATPAVVWGGQMFFVGAWRALRRRTLDMSVLVALSVGAGYLFSVAATFVFRGEVFYEAAVVLLAFILFGHWMEMRARGSLECDSRLARSRAPADDRGARGPRDRGGDLRGRCGRHGADSPRRQDSGRWSSHHRRVDR